MKISVSSYSFERLLQNGQMTQLDTIRKAKDFHVRSGKLTHPGRGLLTTRGGNYINGTIIGHADVPVKQCLKVLKRAGYDGYVSIEFEGLDDNIFAHTVGLDNLKRFTSEI